MSDIAIRVENLGKKYRIQHQQQGARQYKSLRDEIADVPKRLLARFKPKTSEHSQISASDFQSSSVSQEDFWAVEDLSFEIKRGEAVGIIGRNGAGKSTLLKLLSRITEPTKGRIEIEGRVASLLEVGTGFHPELTGRENIYLNGAVLGMHRQEIRGKFDEIVAFAEIEKFLDTPVKRYSSGMYVRLAFAVAAHLDPDILILDEVLAVGDFQFQKKCLGKMGEVVAQTGRTIIFVTHDLGAFQTLCRRGLYLNNGTLQADGSTAEIISIYRQNTITPSQAISNRKGNGKCQYESFYLATDEDMPCEEFFMGDTLVLHCVIKFHEPLKYPVLAVDIKSPLGELSAHVLNLDSKVLEYAAGTYRVTVRMKDVYLAPSSYSLNLWAGDPQSGVTYDFIEGVINFTLIQGNRVKRGIPYPPVAKAFVQSDWNFESTPSSITP